MRLFACSPIGGGTAVITGSVTDPAAAPVVGASVKLRVLNDETCAEPEFTNTGAVRTGAAGRFRRTASWSGGRKCFRPRAEPPQGSAPSASESQLVRVNFGATVSPDSTDLVFRLR